MKVYISVDIEGCAGITHWDEAEKNHADWQEFREQMTREAVAAIEGAQIAGATEILVKDAHSSGRNLIASMLPADVRLIRAWAGPPAVHGAGTRRELRCGDDDRLSRRRRARRRTASPTRCRMMPPRSASTVSRASEYLIHALASSMLGVPTVFVSGDKGLMEEIEEVNPHVGPLRREGRPRPVHHFDDARRRGEGDPRRCRRRAARRPQGVAAARCRST